MTDFTAGIQGVKRYLFDVLEGQVEGRGLLAYLLYYSIIGLILLNVTTLVFETLPSLQDPAYQALFEKIELISLILFTCEYLVRVWVATEDRSRRFQHKIWGRARYMMTPLAVIDFLAVFPSYFAAALGADFRVLRLFRMMRMLKLVRYSPALATLGRVYWAERKSVAAALMIMLTMLLFASTLLWTVEQQAQPEDFASIPHAMWWAISTLTTVGYGDVTPITALGRMIGGVVMVIGIGIFTLPAAILATGFAQEIKRSDFIVSFDRLADVPVFQSLNAGQISVLIKALHTQIFPANYLILDRDEHPKALYIIVEGEVRLSRPDHEEILGPGDFFGALAEFGVDEAYHSHIQTDTDCRFLVLDIDDFNHLLIQWPELRTAIQDSHAHRAQREKTR